MKVHNDIALALDKKGSALLLLLDFSKAFDRVAHTKLVQKLLLKYNFSKSAADMINSYLQGRSQSVFYNGLFSDFSPIDSGVPQGSILGPILFSLFINDLPSVLGFCSVHLFADDVQIYLCCDGLYSLQELGSKMNHDLAKIHEWATDNLLPINPEKTKAIFISRLTTTITPPILTYDGKEISYVEYAENLGIIFDQNFSWDRQIATQCGKIYGSLKKLNLTTRHLDSSTKLRLFKSFVYPLFIYGDFLYHNASERSMNRLRVALNSCIRYVFNLSRFDHVSHLQKFLIGCRFESFYAYRSATVIHRILNTGKPEYLRSLLVPLRSSRTGCLVIPRHNSAYYGNSFFVRGIVNWNVIPFHIKLIKTKSEFKKGLLAGLTG